MNELKTIIAKQFYEGEYSIDEPSQISYDIEAVSMCILVITQIKNQQAQFISKKSLPLVFTTTCNADQLVAHTILMDSNGYPKNAQALLLKERSEVNCKKQAVISKVTPYKRWTIRLSRPIQENYTPAVIVMNSLGERVNITAQVIEKEVLVHPPLEGYQRGETYELKAMFAHVRLNVCYQFTIV